MSGLTPILDTLLHQVLGKRGDVLSGLPKQLSQTVNQVQGAHVVRGSETETRPDPRFVKPAPGSLLRTSEGQVQRPLPSPLSSLPSLLASRSDLGESARITLSPSARLISSLLRGSGEATPVIRSDRSLVTSGDRLPTTQQLAQRLDAIVRESGLFYESHLAKWYAGKMPTGELAREPQMKMAWALGSGLGQSKSLAEAFPHVRNSLHENSHEGRFLNSPVSPRDKLQVESQPLSKTLITKAVAENDESAAATLVRMRNDEDSSTLLQPREARDRLAAIVRHQLELLGAPNIRWEGELVNGLFMMMEIQPPEKYGNGSDGNSQESDGEATWGATFHINLPVLGNLKVSVQQTQENVSVGIVAEQFDTASLLRKQMETVEGRLREKGVGNSLITISTVRRHTQKQAE